MSYLGIDIGSSRVKAVAFSEDGRRLAAAYRHYQYATPSPGFMELDSDAVYRAALAVIAECADAVKTFSPVAAISCSSQGEAFTPLDEAGNALMPAMISGDIRATECMRQFAERFGRERLYHITGHTPSAMFSLAKLLWLKEFAPDIKKRSSRFLCFEDLLAFRLTGRAAMGWPLAGRTMLFDINTHTWNHDLLAALELTEANLAEPLPSGTAVGPILPVMTGELGLRPDVQWVTGGHDQVIGALGCGAATPGMAMYAAGSVECVVPVLQEKTLTPELMNANLCTYDSALPNCYASVGYSLTGSNLLEYFMREIVQDKSISYSTLLNTMPEAPTDLLVLPYFTASGTPYFDAATPGCVYGWRFHTGRGELLKGLLEGVALEMRLNFDFFRNNGVEMQRLIATGGGFRDSVAVQLHADVLNMPIAVCDESEAGCRGAAMLAQRGLGQPTTLPPPQILSVIQPNQEQAAAYREKFSHWLRFTNQIRSFATCQS